MNSVELKLNVKFKSVTITSNILAELFFLLPEYEVKKKLPFQGQPC